MKPPEDRSVRKPAGTADAAPVEVPDEPTDERTVEWDVEQLAGELLEVEDEPSSSPESGRAVVAQPIEDESAGARDPRDLAARRHRRNTVPSVLPSMLAKSMRQTSPAARHRDPAAPTTRPAEVTRRVGADDAVPNERDSSAYSIEVAGGDTSVHTAPTAESPLPTLGPVAMLVDKARRCAGAGDLVQAVLSASEAILANEGHPERGVGDLSDTIGGPLAPLFVMGPEGKIPVINRSELDLDQLALDELGWALLRRLDGRSTLGKILGATRIPPTQALPIAAQLLRDGVIRIDDRARS
jgi:hypothetical protein